MGKSKFGRRPVLVVHKHYLLTHFWDQILFLEQCREIKKCSHQSQASREKLLIPCLIILVWSQQCTEQITYKVIWGNIRLILYLYSKYRAMVQLKGNIIVNLFKQITYYTSARTRQEIMGMTSNQCETWNTTVQKNQLFHCFSYFVASAKWQR